MCIGFTCAELASAVTLKGLNTESRQLSKERESRYLGRAEKRTNMKFLFVIAIVCNYATEAVRPIICFKCSGRTCQSTDEVCTTEPSCQTISITRATDSANRTENGLECFGCYANTSDSCTNHQAHVKCVGQEDRCFYGSGHQSLASIGPTFFARGCVTQNVCDGSTDLNDFLINLSAQTMCCEGILCNVESESLNIVKTTDQPTTDAKNTSATGAVTQTTSPPVTDTSPAAADTISPAATDTTSPAAANATSPAATNTTSTAASKCASTPVAILCLLFLFAHKGK
ncbi:uncharacterized protein LOC119958673 isoform X2 [Scyliorhinus canicula]|uniref:uncharacterized protein LOC119958673 isoform X2 n=1 Tax=Scyliorhinus canicula TaxID=7830 RepID=UPI0018F51D00|nr:uncharacterized protein LOC119958673 isoform X2 [Scyliorhinus canicula]